MLHARCVRVCLPRRKAGVCTGPRRPALWWWLRVLFGGGGTCAGPAGGAGGGSSPRCGALVALALVWCGVPKALLPKGKRPGCLPTGTDKRAGLCVLCARCA